MWESLVWPEIGNEGVLARGLIWVTNRNVYRCLPQIITPEMGRRRWSTNKLSHLLFMNTAFNSKPHNTWQNLGEFPRHQWALPRLQRLYWKVSLRCVLDTELCIHAIPRWISISIYLSYMPGYLWCILDTVHIPCIQAEYTYITSDILPLFYCIWLWHVNDPVLPWHWYKAACYLLWVYNTLTATRWAQQISGARLLCFYSAFTNPS